EDRIINFVKKYSAKPDSKVAVVAVNVNNIDPDRLPKMEDRAKSKNFNFPYAYDESQALGRSLGATVTPEFFVFNKDRKLVYTGAMDDSQDNPKKDYLSPAVDAALTGAPVETAETRAHGCSVVYERK